MLQTRPMDGRSADQFLSRGKLLAIWILALPLMLIGIGSPQVSRTQEARVLETARQMLGRPAIDWMIPRLNGELRLQKPPLAYWMTAVAYKIGGVSEGVGRVPNALLGWLLMLVTYQAGAWLFSRRCGFLSAACLLGSYYFARHSRLAETDLPATLFVTLAIYAFWRGADAKGRSWIGWMHLAAAATGLCVMSKGATGIFPLLFLGVFGVAISRRADHPWRRFIFSAAPLTLAIIALPWFAYVGQHAGWQTFAQELRNTEEGGDHAGTILQYIPWLAVGTAPWPIIAALAVVAAIRQHKDLRLRGLLVWLGAIGLPLCINGNKQSHYLIPLMPVLMILCGWLIDRWNNRLLIGATIACAMALPPIVTLAIPRYAPQQTRAIASHVRETFSQGPYCFYGENRSIPLCFNLRQAIPFADDESELTACVKGDAAMIVISIGKEHRPAIAPPADRFQKVDSMKAGDQIWEFYRAKVSPDAR